MVKLLCSFSSPALLHAKGNTVGRPVVHFEIGCRDRAKTGDFYSKLFGWQINANGPASTIDTGSPDGIPGHITSLGHEPEHYTLFYVNVEDVKAALDQAVELGGKKVVGPIPIPAGKFAWFTDPDGNMIGLMESAKP
jgi:predicted enzyme related to lactoylglutathione lyase